MENYKLYISKKASKELAKLPRSIIKKIDTKLISLSKNPLARKAKKLVGSENNYRIHEGDYRIVYSIESNIVLILRIKHRREIYR